MNAFGINLIILSCSILMTIISANRWNGEPIKKGIIYKDFLIKP